MPKLSQRVIGRRHATVGEVIFIKANNPGIIHEKEAVYEVYKKARRRNKTGFKVDKGFEKFYNQFRVYKCRMPEKEMHQLFISNRC